MSSARGVLMFAITSTMFNFTNYRTALVTALKKEEIASQAKKIYTKTVLLEKNYFNLNKCS